MSFHCIESGKEWAGSRQISTISNRQILFELARILDTANDNRIDMMARRENYSFEHRWNRALDCHDRISHTVSDDVIDKISRTHTILLWNKNELTQTEPSSSKIRKCQCWCHISRITRSEKYAFEHRWNRHVIVSIESDTVRTTISSIE